MKNNRSFTRYTAAILALLLVRVSVCGAGSLTPGRLAILECTVSDHEMRAAWERASSTVRLDPLLLVLNESDVSSILGNWRTAGEAVDAAWRTADRSVLERTQLLLDQAWKGYFTFSFEKALGFLQEAEELLTSPGDSRFRSRLTFEINILKGMILRAAGNGRYMDEFKKAAAVSPTTELSRGKYSPEVISAFSRARDELLSDQKVLVAIDGSPADADILLDGKITKSEQGRARLQVFPGVHFVEADASGYERFSHVLEVVKWDSPALEFNLIQNGPEGEPDEFFLGRLKAGDRSYLSTLVERLDVDYVLIPDGEGGILRPWLVGRDGRVAAHSAIWEPDDDPDSALRNLSAMLKPLRQDREEVERSTVAQMNLPHVLQASQETPRKAAAGQAAGWKRYAAVLGIIVLVAVLTVPDDGGGGTGVEVTW